MFGDDAATSGRVRIKICGITNIDDAHAAIDAGADALGLNCYARSKRFIDLRLARDWVSKLPATIRRIAVLVNPTYEDSLAIADLPFVDGLQLHGQESPEFCAKLAKAGISFAKALPVAEENSVAGALSFSTKTVVLDSMARGAFGGTGTTFPWAIAQRFVEANRNLRVILAGGLTPENVALAVREVRPFAVDVTTGVESSPGRKDHQRLREFVAAVRRA